MSDRALYGSFLDSESDDDQSFTRSKHPFAPSSSDSDSDSDDETFIQSNNPSFTRNERIGRAIQFVSGGNQSNNQSTVSSDDRKIASEHNDSQSSSASTQQSHNQPTNQSDEQSNTQTVHIGFKRRRLEAKQAIDRQKRDDDTDRTNNTSVFESNYQSNGRAGIGSRPGIGSRLPADRSTNQSASAPVSTSFVHPDRQQPFTQANKPAVNPSFMSAKQASARPSNQPMSHPINPSIDQSSVAHRMLAKMGFTGRLGKHEQGINAPIIPTLRPRNAGLGMIDEKGLNNQTSNQTNKHSKDRKNDRSNNQSNNQPNSRFHNQHASRRTDGHSQSMSQSNKHSNSQGKRIYRTIEQIRSATSSSNSQSISQSQGIEIIDMTSGQAVKSSLASINQSINQSTSQSSNQSIIQSQPINQPNELLTHLTHLLNQTEEEVNQINQKIEKSTKDYQSVNQSINQIDEKIQKDQTKIDRFESMMQLVSQTHQYLNNLSSSKTSNQSVKQSIKQSISWIDRLFDQLNEQYRREFHRHRLIDCLMAMIFPIYQSICQSWCPNQSISPTIDLTSTNQSVKQSINFEADSQFLLDVFLPVRKWLDPPAESANQSFSHSVDQSVNSLRNSSSSLYYYQLVDSLIVPKLRVTFSNSALDVTNQSLDTTTNRTVNPAVKLLESFKQICPRSLFNQVIQSSAVPRLQQSIDQWDPRKQSTNQLLSPFDWLPAYSRVLDDQSINQLNDLLRVKLTHVYSALSIDQLINKPSSQSNKQTIDKLIKQWSSLWSDDEIRVFVSKTMLSKISTYLDKLSITNQPIHQTDNSSNNQSINQTNNQPVTDIRLLIDWLPLSSAITLLVQRLVPKLLTALYNMLSNQTNNQTNNQSVDESIDVDNLGDWYLSWKAFLLSNDRLSDQRLIEACKRMLDLINAFLDSQSNNQSINLVHNNNLAWCQQLRYMSGGSTLPQANKQPNNQSNNQSNKQSSSFTTSQSSKPSLPQSNNQSIETNFKSILMQLAAQNNVDMFPVPGAAAAVAADGSRPHYFGDCKIKWRARELFVFDMVRATWRHSSLKELLEEVKKGQTK